MAMRLALIQATAYVAVGALEAQMADRDRAIAQVLQRHIADALESEITKLRAADQSEVRP
jgi:hypothetical protein